MLHVFVYFRSPLGQIVYDDRSRSFLQNGDSCYNWKTILESSTISTFSMLIYSFLVENSGASSEIEWIFVFTISCPTNQGLRQNLPHCHNYNWHTRSITSSTTSTSDISDCNTRFNQSSQWGWKAKSNLLSSSCRCSLSLSPAVSRSDTHAHLLKALQLPRH